MDGRRADRLIRDDVDDDVCIGRARVGLMEKTDGRTDGRGVRSFVFSRSRTRCGVWNWIWNGGALMLAARAAHSLPIMYSYLRPPLFSNPSSDFGVGRSVGRTDTHKKTGKKQSGGGGGGDGDGDADHPSRSAKGRRFFSQ